MKRWNNCYAHHVEPHVRRKALQYAAKLAFGSLAIGCGGKVIDEQAVPDATTDDALAEASFDASYESGVCTGVVEADANITDELIQCCIDTIGAAADAGTLDAGDVTQVSCCHALSATSSLWTDGSWPDPTLYRCCGVVKTSYCSPWGPPMPPAMNEWRGANA